MNDTKIRRRVRSLLRALRKALPAMREVDRAYRALMGTSDKHVTRPAKKKI